ncbi:TorF family putative porin [Hyphomicrobium sp. NDB2Meth4]|uniref:TorF family putative porin n=1 Tax=Hyphomicrobium sp. NDB2Meth4 TaxID=1892846 RepID=UPI000931D83B|nr:TorF family putative porin [Hyphomicrobium sp. NDB2Meth4]
MAESRSVIKLVGVAGIALLALTSGALADGYEGSIKDAPVKPEREFTYSFSITGTSDYVFRGISQTDNDPTIQGSVGIGYGIFYAGAWGSGLDFGGDSTGFGEDAQVEIDYYAGIKPTWGPATFDFGVIYYTYPGAGDSLAELDYVELKAGVSGEILKGLTAGGVAYWSPEYTGEVGETWTFEGSLAYALPQLWIFSPTVSGLVGHVDADAASFIDYTYWNAGLSLAVDKITFDLRYWDTDLSKAECFGTSKCDERFVFSLTVALP